MRKLLAVTAAATFVALSGAAPRATAADPLIDWAVQYHVENGWVNGVSLPGAVMSAYGVINDFNGPLAGNPFAGHEYTIVFQGLLSAGTVANCGGPLCTYSTNYLGGNFLVYDDLGPGTAADPCNPGSYTDGTVLLSGTFSGFFMNASNFSTVGNFEGDLTFTGGTQYALVANPGTALVTGGSDRRASLLPGCASNANIVQVLDGKVDLNPPVPVEESSWGRIKSLYR